MSERVFVNKFKRFVLALWKAMKTVFVGIGRFVAKVWKHKRGRVGMIMLSMIVLIALFAPLLTPYDPYVYEVAFGLQKPSWQHWLGTDRNGVDILTQLLYGTRVSLIIGLVTSLSVTALGAILGIVAGYFGRVASGIILNIINVLLVIPTLPLMIVLNRVSSSYVMMIFIFVAFGWAGTARMVRAQVLAQKNMNYVKQAELAGAGKGYIMFKHILPAVSHLLIMNTALACAGFMIAEAGLSFIGLGDPNAISWGKLLVKAQESAFSAGLWAWVLAPGAAIFVTVIACMQIGYAVEDIFNPRMGQINKLNRAFDKLRADDIQSAFDSMEDMDEAAAREYKQEYNNKVDMNNKATTTTNSDMNDQPTNSSQKSNNKDNKVTTVDNNNSSSNNSTNAQNSSSNNSTSGTAKGGRDE